MDTSEDPRPIIDSIIMIPKRTHSYLDDVSMGSHYKVNKTKTTTLLTPLTSIKENRIRPVNRNIKEKQIKRPYSFSSMHCIEKKYDLKKMCNVNSRKYLNSNELRYARRTKANAEATAAANKIMKRNVAIVTIKKAKSEAITQLKKINIPKSLSRPRKGYYYFILNNLYKFSVILYIFNSNFLIKIRI